MIKRETLKKLLSICLIIALVFTTMSYQPSIAKAAGDGSSYATAEELQLDQNKSLTFFSGDSNYYGKFTIPEQGIVTFKTVDKNMTDQAFGFKYILYDNNGKTIWGGEKKSYNSINPNYSGSVGLAAGTYTVKIDPEYFYKENRNIDFVVNFIANKYCEIESNEYIADATPMELGHFYDIYFGGKGSGENDFFKFKAEKNKFYRATITNFDIVDPTTTIFHVYDPKGEQVESLRFDTKIDKDGNYIYEFKTEMTGEYKIRVYNYHGEQFHFKLKIAKCPFYPEIPEYYNFKANLSTLDGGYDDVHLSWDKIKGATGYEIYMKKGNAKTYTFKGKTSNLYYNVKNLADGAKYYFKMRPYYSDGENIYRKNAYKFVNIWTLKKINTPYVKRSSKYSPECVDVSWNKIYGDVRYQISRSTSKTGTYVVASTYSNKYSYLKGKVNKGYYYKVRAYAEVYRNGKYIKVFAPWSDVKYCRTTR